MPYSVVKHDVHLWSFRTEVSIHMWFDMFPVEQETTDPTSCFGAKINKTTVTIRNKD